MTFANRMQPGVNFSSATRGIEGRKNVGKTDKNRQKSVGKTDKWWRCSLLIWRSFSLLLG
jgi:hypothetical protein